ncbi:MAG: SPOR domain-containing protein [Acidobacteriota bacterium]|nr:SPOR domain-containing protein [Acidobacteriota bacterium]
MQRGIGGGEFEPIEERRDTELTLGPVALTAIGLGLVMLCGLCFGLGYAAGRRGPGAAAAANAQPAAGQPVAAQTGGMLSKPAAASAVSAASPAVADMEQLTPAEGSQPGNALTSYAPASSSPAPDSGQALVRPALPQGGAPQPAPAAAANPQVQTAMPQGAALMVQVAALSQVEDARVLVTALRQRGYAVTARREAADSLIHVQVGPFANRNDANAMCQRLLGDGYSAVVEP